MKEAKKKSSSKKWSPRRKPAPSPYKGQTVRKFMPHHNKPCGKGQVIHHTTGRCVKRTSPIGNKAEHYKEVYSGKMRGGNKKSPVKMQTTPKKRRSSKKSMTPKKRRSSKKASTPKKRRSKKASTPKKRRSSKKASTPKKRRSSKKRASSKKKVQ